jgi:hypothetical protein
MSVYVPVANTVQAELRQTLGGQQLMNVQHWEFGSTVTIALMEALGDGLITWWSAFMAPLLTSNLSLIELYLTDLTSVSSATVSRTAGLPAFGVIGVESMPSNVAACISFKTASRGRSFQGRNYIAGLSINDVLLNIIDLDVRQAIVNAYINLGPMGDDLNANHVVVSRYSGYTIVDGKKIPTPRAAGITSDITTYKFTTDSVRTQRDRLP